MQQLGNINFSLVGAKGTGKTVYLTSLYLNEKCITAKNARTIEYLKPLSNILLEGEYPGANIGNLHELMFNYKDENFSCPIQLDDVDGHFIETLAQNDEVTQKDRDKFINNLKMSNGILFFFPYETNVKEKSIKAFQYEIDTVIAKLKEIYKSTESIPIPAVIGITKWDDSPHYQIQQEEKEVLSYIENHMFLRLAKEKIEMNFENIKLIPLSAIGQDINNLKPYNLNSPIKFFLEETFTSWVNKLNALTKSPKAQLSLLSKIHIDIQTYDKGKYDKLYKELEKEYATKLLEEVTKIKSVQKYRSFQEKNQIIIDALLPENKSKLKNIKNKLKKFRLIKIFSISILIISIIFLIYKWSMHKQILKNEAQLFNQIRIEISNKDFEEAKIDLETYILKYDNTRYFKHPKEILDFKSNVEQALKIEMTKTNHEKYLSEAKHIVNDPSYADIDNIDDVYSYLNKQQGYDELKSKLLEIKKRLLLLQDFTEFKQNIQNRIFKEALDQVDTYWKDDYGENNKIIITNILNKHLNTRTEKLLKEISSVNSIDEFQMLKDTLNSIDSLKNNTEIKKINFRAKLNIENENILISRIKVYNNYLNLFKHGITMNIITFGAESKENEKLGFRCGAEDEIILKIDTWTYHHNRSSKCNGLAISWNSTQTISISNYDVQVIEVDTFQNDYYNGSFSLTDNDLINLYNQNPIKKDIGQGYYLKIGQ